MEKELLIQEKEKLYMELKQILQRQPGPEVAEQLQIYQQTLKEKTKQMKVSSSVVIIIYYGRLKLMWPEIPYDRVWLLNSTCMSLKWQNTKWT